MKLFTLFFFFLNHKYGTLQKMSLPLGSHLNPNEIIYLFFLYILKKKKFYEYFLNNNEHKNLRETSKKKKSKTGTLQGNLNYISDINST